MSAQSHGSTGVILLALSINLAIAAIKAVAAFISGSASMSAEAIHSLVDCGNQLFLLIGLKMSLRPASVTHPLGRHTEIYVWSFLVAVVLFVLGGVQTVSDGISHIMHPHEMASFRLFGHMIPAWVLNIAILGISVVLEGKGFLAARSALLSQQAAGNRSMIRSLLRSTDPGLFVVMFEDAAAVTGLWIAFVFTALSVFFQAPILDGVASLLIGVMLLGVAVVMGHEIKSLLIGEANREVAGYVRGIAREMPEVTNVNSVIAVQRGPEAVIVLASLDWDDSLTGAQIEASVGRLGRRIRDAYPAVVHINVEAMDKREHAMAGANH